MSRFFSFLFVLAISVFLLSCSKPILVTHWSQKDAALVKKKGWGWPEHKWYSRVVCFDQKCRKKAEWVKHQRNDRFKGFKDGGKLPPKPPTKTGIPDSILIAKSAKPVQTNPVIAPVHKPVVLAAPVLHQDSLIVLNEVLFEVNSYKLKRELFPKLDSIVVFMKANPRSKIRISGHTDSSGKAEHNLRLSENRADAVAEFIVDQGIETSRVSFNGYGSSQPIAVNSTEAGRMRNRRVEVLIRME